MSLKELDRFRDKDDIASQKGAVKRFKFDKNIFLEGIKAGVPIGLGYLAVSFSLGIVARNVGFDVIQSFLVSFFNNASAGEYAGFTLIAAGATYLEVAIITFIANMRYLLMSCAISQKFEPGTPLIHKLLVGFDLTDELFAIAISRPGSLNPWFSYGAILVALPAWAGGTALGCVAGNIMPERLVSAFSVALYGMFLAVIIPAAKKDKVVAGLIVVCFLLSYLVTYLDIFSGISSGIKTIALTLIISAVAAIIFPHREEEAR